jgi:hypothetical protein
MVPVVAKQSLRLAPIGPNSVNPLTIKAVLDLAKKPERKVSRRAVRNTLLFNCFH